MTGVIAARIARASASRLGAAGASPAVAVAARSHRVASSMAPPATPILSRVRRLTRSEVMFEFDKMRRLRMRCSHSSAPG
jgi:hypothetical protein